MTITLDGTKGTTTPGLYSSTTFTGSYADGIVVDYTTGLGRISVGSADGVAFYNGGVATTELMRLDASGNLGLGVTPSAWESGAKVLQFSTAGVSGASGDTCAIWARGDTMRLTNGVYFNGTNYIYSATGIAPTIFGMGVSPGGYTWQTASSGTAGGTVSFTQAMTLNANGQLLLGTTSAGTTDAPLIVSNGGAAGLEFSPTAISGENRIFSYNRSGSSYAGLNLSAADIKFLTGGSERARIDSSGRLLVNTTSGTANALFQVSSNGTKQSFQVFNNDNVQLYSLGTGTVTCSGGVLSYTSDERLKIADGVFSGGLEAVQNIVPQYFYWKGEDGQQDPNRPRELGFFAQNIQATCGQEVAPDPHREDLHLGIHDRGVMAVLVSALQEQQALITQLQADVASLKAPQ